MGLTALLRESAMVNQEKLKILLTLFLSGGDYQTGRFNEGNKDLNRDFPTWREVNSTAEYLYLDREPETKVGTTQKIILDNKMTEGHDGLDII